MKNLLLLFVLLSFINVNGQIKSTENVPYYITQNDVVVDSYSSFDTADRTASNLKTSNPDDVIKIVRPDYVYEISENGELIVAKIDVYVIDRLMFMKLDTGTKKRYWGKCNSNRLVLVSSKVFDFKDETITLNNVLWYNIGLENNGQPITIEEAKNQGLILENCQTRIINDK